MEWRCEWCGKPHPADDPPCDNCGHGTFERAVVRESPGDVGTGTTTLWVCPACEREHPKHSPPCSRCGNPTLEQVERGPNDYEDIEASSYRDLVTPRYLVGLIAVLGLALVVGLGIAGVIQLPGMTESDVPSVAGVPGNDTTAAGLELTAVEASLVDAINERRDSAGLPTLRRDDRLDAVATFYTERLVRARLENGSLPSDGQLRDLLMPACGDAGALLTPELYRGTNGVVGQRSAEAAGDQLAARFPTNASISDDPGQGLIGVGLHVGPDDTTYLTRILC